MLTEDQEREIRDVIGRLFSTQPKGNEAGWLDRRKPAQAGFSLVSPLEARLAIHA